MNSTKSNNSHPISVVVPCFNEEDNVDLFHESLVSLKIKDIELIFIDDGSEDQTWEKITQLIQTSSEIKIKGVQFTRNFGKEAAIEAGLRECSHDVIVTIDSDLQHPVEKILEMLELWHRNPDIHIINGVKINRQKEFILKKPIVSVYYFFFRLSTGIQIQDHSDFKLIDRSVLDQYLALKECNKFYRGLTSWLGYHAIDLPFEPNQRRHGKQSWSFKSLVGYAKNSILSFSFLPLKVITWIGLTSILFSAFLTVDTVWKKVNGTSAEGFPTVILLQLGLGSLILFSLGIIAEYLSEIYKEQKGRPSFIVNSQSDNKKK